ncbi:MAG TPA: response regulator [Solirubrobacteraceae bacterium]|nr:response regulator [Solirubrobacteraceae bacterium]
MTDIDAETLAIAREEAIECLERIEANLLALEGNRYDSALLDALFRDAHSVKGASSMVGWNHVSSIAHRMEDQLEVAREGGELPREQVDPLLQATDALRRAVDVATGADEPALAGPTSPQPTQIEPVELEQVRAQPAPAERARLGGAPAAARAGQRSLDGSQRAMRVPAEKVDRMLDAVGEAALHQRRLEHIVGQRIAASGDENAVDELDRGERLLNELQDAVISMRTLPLDTVTAPFPRAVREIAVAEGKEADLVIRGGDTQLDRVILEGIADPVVHLLRNSVAHGIEPPDERERAGKPRRGRIELRAEQRGGLVAIEVADDGRGVSEELLARAADAGSLTEVLAAPGVSTAVEVSDLAGRGVGLDAVKNHVEMLGGSIEVRSEPGQTTVRMLLPITLAVLGVLLCERAGQPYGVPMASVQEIVTVTETASLGGRPSLDHRGQTIPITDLATAIGASERLLTPPSPALVLASATRTVAVACDRVLGDRELVVKSLGPLLAGIPGYLGAGIIEDGRVALILDPNRLLEMPWQRGAPLAATVAQARAPGVLVVDDQFSVRQLQRSILESAGYRVDTARHGREALEKIVAGADVDLVVTDLQMPEMDGLELLRAIRSDASHESLPVAIVTSNGSEEDRRRGAAEGADAYIVKSEFNQQALLETIERLVGR